MIKFFKTRNVPSPERDEGNAGFDFFIPAFDADFKQICEIEAKENPASAVHFVKYDEEEVIVIKPHSTVKIPSGIHARIEIPSPLCGYGCNVCLDGANKSGVATKLNLSVGAELIDPNYQGEIHISLINNNDFSVYLKPHQKIVQYVSYLYLDNGGSTFDKSQMTLEEFYKDAKYSNRGSDGFGSTDKK